MRRSLFLVLFNLGILSIGQITAQTTISGLVSDQDGKRIKGVLVTLINNQDIILAVSSTDSLGIYKLVIDRSIRKDSLFIQVNEIGYSRVRIPIIELNAKIDIQLSLEYKSLQSVVVHASKPLIVERSDTLRYNVDSFSTKQDRTILDVIKKLPGIDVMESGEIKFQGKSINALYVDGDNLMDGKYNSLTKSLPNDIATSIEILRNHQPIQTLQGVQFSDAPGLNIVLKDKSRMKMMVEGGAGIGVPSLYDTKVNAMTFRKSFKMLSSLKVVNTGKDLKQDLMTHFRSDADLRNDKELLGTEVALAPLSPSRVLLNKDILEDINLLFKTKKGLDLRMNFSYYNTSLRNERQAEQYFILPTDTISYNERMFTKYKESLFRVGLNALINKKSTYFNNNFSIEGQYGKAQSEMFASSLGDFTESYKSRKIILTNSARYIKVLTPKIIFEAYSYLFYKNIPQENQLLPGLYNTILNNGQPYDILQQEGQTNGSSTRNYLTLRFPGKFTSAFKTGIDVIDQNLSSNLDKLLNGIKMPIADSFSNNLSWNRTRLYSEYSITKNSGNTSIEFKLPIENNWIRYTDSLTKERHQYIFLQPSVKIRTKLGKRATLNLNTYLIQNIGSYYDIYSGYILNGYRSFTSKGGILPITKNKSAAISYELNNAPRFLFISTAFSVNHMESNVIPFFMLSNMSTSIINQEYTNTTLGYSYTFSIAKYMRSLKTLLTVQPAYIRNEFNQLQNDFLLSYLNNTWNLNIKTTSKISSFLNLGYSGIINQFTNRPKNSTLNAVLQKTNSTIHKLDVNIALHPTLMLTGMTEWYRNKRIGNNRTNTIEFIDLVLNYKPEKSKFECGVSFFNVLNNQTYTNIGSSSNAYNQSSFLIRPRNIVLHFNYRF